MKGQISLEFSLLFLAALLAVIIAVGHPGIFGLKKTTELSSMSLAHAAVSKMKQNIDLVGVADENTTKVVYIKCPPGIWEANNNNLYFYNNNLNYNISTTCDININLKGNTTIQKSEIISVTIKKIDNTHVDVTISS